MRSTDDFSSHRKAEKYSISSIYLKLLKVFLHAGARIQAAREKLKEKVQNTHATWA